MCLCVSVCLCLLCVCVCVSAYMCVVPPQRPEEGIGPLGTGDLTDTCESHLAWEQGTELGSSGRGGSALDS